MTPARPLRFGEFVVLMAMMTATVAFSIDAMLPGMPVIGATLSPEAPNRVQLIVTLFMVGLGAGTLLAGPLSDRFGRKPVVVAGLAIYGAAALAAAQAQTIEALLAARFVQGMGAAAPRVVAIAIIRDQYSGRPMARVTSIVMTIFILVPILAPAAGAGIIALSGWRAIFLAFVVFALVCGLWLMLRQPETLAPEARRPLRARSLIAAVAEVVRSRRVLTYIAALSLGFGQMLIFLSTVPQVFADVWDRAATMPYWFALVAVMAGVSGAVNATLVMAQGMRRLATLAFAVQATVSALYLVVAGLFDLPQPYDFYLFIAYLCAAFFMIGLTFGNLNALAMEPLGHIAGTASAVIGALSTFAAAAIAIPAGLTYAGSEFTTVGGVLVCATLAFALMLTTRDRPGAGEAVRPPRPAPQDPAPGQRHP